MKSARNEMRDRVRESLIEQLAVGGLETTYNIDLVDDYMQFWDTKEKLQADIKKRGVTYKDVSSVGVEMQKNNPSVKELVMVNRQMLTLLDSIGIKPIQSGGDADDEL